MSIISSITQSSLYIKSVDTINRFRPYLKQKQNKLKIYIPLFLIASLVLIILFINRRFVDHGNQQVTSPTIDMIATVTEGEAESSFDSIKNKIKTFSSALPDISIPILENNINLEKPLN